MICSITGRFIIGTIGFGMSLVSGSSLEPTPAARIIAFIRNLPSLSNEIATRKERAQP